MTDAFLVPRFTGERFKKKRLPLEFLKDLAALEELIVEVAKEQYLKDNTKRKRLPSRFTKAVKLELSGIGEGSVKAYIALALVGAGLCSEYTPYYESAKESFIQALDEAANQKEITALAPSALSRFDRFGRSLIKGEAIEFSDRASKVVKLTPETRKILVDKSKRRTHTETVSIRGWIPEADQDKMTFSIKMTDGRTVESSMDEDNFETILEAFNRYKQDSPKILLQGIGIYDRRNDRLKGFESVEHITLLDPLDVHARLDEFKLLKDGWLDGRGKAPRQEDMEWFAESFENNFPEDLPLPYLYPTLEGGIRAEWTLGDIEVTLDVDVDSRDGYLHFLDMEKDEEKEYELNLALDEGWGQVNEVIHNLKERIGE